MLARCWQAQWRGFTSEEQAYMEQESDRGHPTFIALGHDQYNIWVVDHFTAGWAYPLTRRSGDQLISVKVDHWPTDFPEIK